MPSDVGTSSRSAGGASIAELQKLARGLPRKPGVYLFKDARGTVLYVGKAKSLRARVSSYFNAGGVGAAKDLKTQILVSKIADLEVIVTASEYESLLLENSLIKDRTPRYNINLKDGKSYPVIRLTKEEFPKVFRTRTIILDGSEYFGPFPKVNQIDVYLNLVDKLFPLRKRGDTFKTRQQPCLNYHIGRCAAPCVGYIDAADYAKRVDAVRKLLSGKGSEVVRELRQLMQQEAQQLRFEKAAEYRDQIRAITEVATSEQNVVDFSREARDYVGFHREEAHYTVAISHVRHGQLLGKDRFRLVDSGAPDEVLPSFLLQFYGGNRTPPRRVFVQLPADAAEMLQLALEETGGNGSPRSRIEVRVPRRGRHAQFLRMVEQNARVDWETGKKKREDRDEKLEALEALRDALALDAAPRRIEGFDISHLSGQDTVASLVVFVDGRPEKRAYRTFKMRTLGGRVDDFESMREVIARRYTRLLNDNRPLPDLVLVDGGKGQVSAAVQILRALGADRVPVAGLAKRNEEVFLPGRAKAVVLADGNPALRVLQAVRDESHRFATGFNQRLRSKRIALSLLESARGVGRIRARKLLEVYGSVDAMLGQSPEQLASRAGLTREIAATLLVHLEQQRGREAVAGAAR